MSDDITKYALDDQEFRSEFDVELQPAEVDTFKWLFLGHLVYIVGLTLAIFLQISEANIWMTPLFAIPLLWSHREQRSWSRILVFVLGFTALHYAAIQLAANAYPSGESLVPGAIGGLVGSAGALLLCAAFGMIRGGVGTLVFATFGVLMMTLAGSFGVHMYLTYSGDDPSFAGRVVRMLWIYTPWQVIFAFVLSKVLRPV